jgi:hypothetical protein
MTQWRLIGLVVLGGRIYKPLGMFNQKSSDIEMRSSTVFVALAWAGSTLAHVRLTALSVNGGSFVTDSVRQVYLGSFRTPCR